MMVDTANLLAEVASDDLARAAGATPAKALCPAGAALRHAAPLMRVFGVFQTVAGLFAFT